MKDWFSKNLGDAMLAHDSLHQLEKLFSAAYARAGKPGDMAAFMRHESEGRLHCEVKVYLSPSFFAVAEEVNAELSSKPSPAGLSILVGSQECWSTLFPEYPR